MATTTKKKSGGSGLSALVTPSSDLAAIVGDKPMPRSEITKKVWDYIKANGLQDQTNKRMINADDKLLKIFNGKKQVSMFEMTALVSKHLKA
jgi:chromatin remodeling complex protein RSC6